MGLRPARSDRESNAGSTRVAAPGCYPTAALLAIAPLVKAGIAGPAGIVVNAVSGATGAGRALQTDMLFGEVAEGVRPYGLGGHRHRPEMEMALERLAGMQISLSFTPIWHRSKGVWWLRSPPR